MEQTHDFEFQLSCYLDGSLDNAQRMEVEDRLRRDPQARALYQEYRQLDSVVKTFASAATPAVNWDRFAEHLSQAVANQANQAASYPMPWLRGVGRLAIAASLLVGVGLVGFHVLHATNTTNSAPLATVPATQPASTVIVQGPTLPPPSGKPSIDVGTNIAPHEGPSLADGDNSQHKPPVAFAPSADQPNRPSH